MSLGALSLPEAPTKTTGAAEIVLDLSRLLSRSLHPTPTGVDRVELAYAQGLLRLAPDRLSFAATHPCGLHGRLSTSAVVDFLAMTADRWDCEGLTEPRLRRWRRALAACLTLAPGRAPARRPGRPRAYLHPSPRSLERRAMFEAILRREQARFIPFVHDLIPLDHPEYTRPRSTALFTRKIETVTALASGVLVNSRATADALAACMARCGRSVPIEALALGAGEKPSAQIHRLRPSASHAPYFVALGTIEPRKNHLMLLNVWRRLVEVAGASATPRLVLIGRRGWENENVLDLLDRCPSLRDVVTEQSRLSDQAMRQILADARALLFPSFAEGYGLPVAEALSLGVPVLASDLPALRETGGDAPDYLDPLDSLAWMRAVLDYAAPQSQTRARQLARLGQWRAPTWEAHLTRALSFIDRVMQ
jgi:glycosyltransferase involved in cell wall biosynthesis